MYETGKRLFFTRGGTHDFSCASCHGADDKRIRLQDLPNLTKNPGDGIGFAAWPAYRVSNAQMWGMQLRLNDCFRQMRWPEPKFGSDATLALSAHGRQRQGRRSRARSSAEERPTMNKKPSSPSCRWPRCSPPARCRPRRPTPKATADTMKNSFQAKGIATLDRRAGPGQCHLPSRSLGQPGRLAGGRGSQHETIKWPSDGKFWGLEEGEKIAQSGVA